MNGATSPYCVEAVQQRFKQLIVQDDRAGATSGCAFYLAEERMETDDRLITGMNWQPRRDVLAANNPQERGIR